jgi:hypothetical protein
MRAGGACPTTEQHLPRPWFAFLTAALFLAVFLIFAGTASAETWAGESTTQIGEAGAAIPEIELVRGSATYDSSGSLTVALTTAGPPQQIIEKKLNEAMATAILAHTPTAAGCSPIILVAEIFPLVGFSSSYSEPGTAKGAIDFSSEGGEELPATKLVSGDTTTLTLSSGRVANLGLNCAFVFTGSEEGGTSAMVFPLKVLPPPPLPPAPGPPPPPARLEITKPKPVKLTVGKWGTVKVTVGNPGGSTLSQGTLRVKPAKGVYLKPETQKLPVLTPGDSFALSVRVELTKRAKRKTTLSLTASGAGGITDTSSLVVKAAPKG